MSNFDLDSWLNVWNDLISYRNKKNLSDDDALKLKMTFATLGKVAEFFDERGKAQKLSNEQTLLDKQSPFGNEAFKESLKSGLILSKTEKPSNKCHRDHDMINELKNTPQTLSHPKGKGPNKTPESVSKHGLDKNKMEIEGEDVGVLMNKQESVAKQKPNLLNAISENISPALQTIPTQETSNMKNQQHLAPLKDLEKNLNPKVPDSDRPRQDNIKTVREGALENLKGVRAQCSDPRITRHLFKVEFLNSQEGQVVCEFKGEMLIHIGSDKFPEINKDTLECKETSGIDFFSDLDHGRNKEERLKHIVVGRVAALESEDAFIHILNSIKENRNIIECNYAQGAHIFLIPPSFFYEESPNSFFKGNNSKTLMEDVRNRFKSLTPEDKKMIVFFFLTNKYQSDQSK